MSRLRVARPPTLEGFRASFPGAIDRYVAGETLKHLAAALGINRGYLRRMMQSAGVLRAHVPTARRHLWDPDKAIRHGKREAAVRLVVAEYIAGKSIPRIAREHDFGKQWVGKIIKAAGVSRGRFGPFKNQLLLQPLHGMMGKVFDATLARELGCHRSTVSWVRRGQGIRAYTPPNSPPIRIYSIDAPRFLGGSFHEVHRDHSWSNWLEEMGATVW